LIEIGVHTGQAVRGAEARSAAAILEEGAGDIDGWIEPGHCDALSGPAPPSRAPVATASSWFAFSERVTSEFNSASSNFVHQSTHGA